MTEIFKKLLLVLSLVGLPYSVASLNQRPRFKKLVSNVCDNKGKYILSNNRKTWVLALEACENVGLQLAKVRSETEVEEMKAAIEYFLGPRDESLKKFDNRNWIWLGGNDLKLEGNWEWLDGTLVDDWDVPWIKKAGKDNSKHVGGLDGQNALSFSKWGKFDDSYHNDRRKKRPFACQCPET